MEVQFPVIDNESCKMKFAAVDKRLQIDDRIICAGDLKGGKDACQVHRNKSICILFGEFYIGIHI